MISLSSKLNGIGDSRKPGSKISNIAPSLETLGRYLRGAGLIKKSARLKRDLSIIELLHTFCGTIVGIPLQIEKCGSYILKGYRFVRLDSMLSSLSVRYSPLYTFIGK